MALSSDIQLRTTSAAAPLHTEAAGSSAQSSGSAALAYARTVATWLVAQCRRWDAHQERIMDTAAQRPENVHLLFPRI